MIYAEILAGGKGTRMGNTELPKQFLMLGDKPIVIHTLEQFLLNPNIDRILLCTPKQWMSHARDIIKKYLGENEKIVVVEGGDHRNGTILNGCKYIEDNYGINDDDIIITHDAVRPFITQRIIDDNIEAVKKYGATDTVIGAIDTIVESPDNGMISNIPVRGHMYQGQTPQSFILKQMKEVLEGLSDEEKDILTDACKAYVTRGIDVKLVEGEVFNIKITTQYDLKIANAIVEKRG